MVENIVSETACALQDAGGCFPRSYCLSLCILCFQGKKWKLIALVMYIYIHIYIFTTDPLDLNIQINTKTTKIALFCRNIVGFWHAQPWWGAHESYHEGICSHLWLPLPGILNITFVEGVQHFFVVKKIFSHLLVPVVAQTQTSLKVKFTFLWLATKRPRHALLIFLSS